MGLFSNVITGINTAVSVYGAAGGGGHGAGHAQCDLFAVIDQIFLQTLPQIQSQIGHVPNAEVLQALQAVRNAIYSLPTAGCNAGALGYLAQAKADIDHDIEVYTNQFNGTGTGAGSVTVMTGANGQTVQVPSVAGAPSMVAEIPNSYLIGGAVAVLGLVYVLKK